MKRLFALIAVFGMLVFMASKVVVAQDSTATKAAPAQVAVATDSEEAAAIAAEEGQSAHGALKQKFIEGGPGFMTSILLCMIFGLAFAIERVLYLSLASTNTKKLLAKVEAALENGGIEAAKDVCRNTPGPIASIFFQGLDRAQEGIDVVEKSDLKFKK